MSFNTAQLHRRLSALAADGKPSRFVVAFSGGMDSTVLLHALGAGENVCAIPIVALHVDHGLHADAGRWEEHCRALATSMALAYDSVSITVERNAGRGLEAAAREARYRALQQRMRSGDWLLSAHHRDDQAETLLLNLLRGSGMAGMAGIGEKQQFGPGFLVRPLLDVARRDLRAYADTHALEWLDDPSNKDCRFDRNFLRREILPLLSRRWPAAKSRLAHSAALAGEARTLLDELADEDLALVGFPANPDRIGIAALLRLSDARQRNLLRRALRRCGLAAAPATRLRQILDELIPARPDAGPLVAWPGVRVRRYRDCIYLQAELTEPDKPAKRVLGAGNNTLALGSLGHLRIVEGAAQGIRPELLAAGLGVRFRAGGEEIRPPGHACTHKLKKLLQQKAVVPWMRDKIPLLYAGEMLVAVADLWVAAGAADAGGQGIEWLDHPAIF